MQYRLLALDMDGTLVTREDRVRPAVQKSLARLQDHRISIVLATGRRYSRAAARYWAWCYVAGNHG